MSYRKRNSYSQRSRSYGGRRRRTQRKNYMPLIVSVFVVLFVGFLLVKLVGVLFSTVHSEQVSAEVQVLQGRTEYFFPEQNEWSGAISDMTFREGDSIRTNINSRASLELFPGTIVFLNENSEMAIETLEESSSGKKNVVLTLRAGEIWAKTSSEDFHEDTGSVFQIKTEQSQINVRGTIFDFQTLEGQDTLRLVKGTVDVDILDESRPEDPWNVLVEVGQKLTINALTLEKLKAETDVKEIMDSAFVESEWHLQNIEQFLPEEAAVIRRQIELKAPKIEPKKEVKISNSTENLIVSDTVAVPEILSPESGTVVAATQDSIKLEGTAPENTMQIVVNGYALTQFTAGDRKWRYFASKKFGTLLPGENTYEVVAVFRDGTKSKSAHVSLQYEGAVVASNGNDVPVINSSITEFKAPIVTQPTAINAGVVYETARPAFSMKGLVDPKTNRVVVNDYQLKAFKVGNTNFTYGINSEASNPNMVPGENTYTITAFGPDGKKASTTIVVSFKPIILAPVPQ